MSDKQRDYIYYDWTQTLCPKCLKLVNTKIIFENSKQMYIYFPKLPYLCTANSKSSFGGLAHLARARHWQCRGDRFESGNLHKRKSGLKEALKPILVLFLWPIFKLLV